MRFLSNTKFLVLIFFIIALILRLFMVTSDPPSLNWDEASLGYNAFSILKTGKDEWGRSLPLTFEAFGDYKLPGYIYTLVPFVSILGLNEFSVRIPSVLAGSISVVLVYLIVYELTKNKKWALLSSSLLAISPWHFFLSRIALEANLALAFFLSGFYLLTLGLKRSYFLIPASIFFGLSVFTYNSARVFIPLFIFAFLILNLKKIKPNLYSIISAIIICLFLGYGFFLALFQDSSARYYWVKILDEGAINYLESARNNSNLNGLVTNIIYNRYTYFIANFLLNYLKHFSPQFLGISGGSNYQFSLPGLGLVYLIELPFLLFGAWKLIREKTGLIFLAWVLIAPIPAALTRESPHALRSIFMLGGLQVIIAFGIIQYFMLINNKKIIKNFSLGLIGILLLVNALFFYKSYFYDYHFEYSQAWQYGYKQAVEFINSTNYPAVYFTKKYGEPHIFYLFFSNYSPKNYQTNPTLLRYEKSNWRWVDRLDKIYFVNDWEIANTLEGKKGSLAITSPGSYPQGSKILSTIYFLDGSKAFEIVEI